MCRVWCEACGAGEDRTVQRWLEAHEQWVCVDAARVQRWKRPICLRTDCHTVTHYGYAQVRGREAKAFAHLVKVTGMSHAEARRHIGMAFTVRDVCSATSWTLDLSILTDAGITLRRPPSATERPGGRHSNACRRTRYPAASCARSSLNPNTADRRPVAETRAAPHPHREGHSSSHAQAIEQALRSNVVQPAQQRLARERQRHNRQPPHSTCARSIHLKHSAPYDAPGPAGSWPNCLRQKKSYPKQPANA